MSEPSSETNPQIQVNNEHQEQQQQDNAAAAGEPIPSVGLTDECSEDNVSAEKETQARMQSVFQQVRNQIKSQVGAKAPKNSIQELVQRVKDREMEIGQLEATKKALRDEFEVQISQVRKEMQAYTDMALKDLECKMESWQPHNLPQARPIDQQESKGPDKKQKPLTAPSLDPRRGRVLTRTMTTIIPKTCAPVVICPRAKSETMSTSKGQTSQLQLRDPLLSLPGNKQYLCRKPAAAPSLPTSASTQEASHTDDSTQSRAGTCVCSFHAFHLQFGLEMLSDGAAGEIKGYV
ncbi:hypothetical protein L3Q82_006759 [Scortum barcoo]|uniref:Uncharacterized protein n=1 Tax=Scortum barcoo TaxID=214431 RepID=A0ACB8WVY2_9TELE|nr:hypothetical protein L3Q82_006759 [Scortum barcoo]